MKASVRVNTEKLRYNWKLGRDLVQKKAEERWGAGVVEQMSLDMQREFPDADGFSTTNLWYMKKWYLFYNETDTKLHQAGGELEDEKVHQLGGEFPPAFGLVPWRHHVEIISKCKSIDFSF